MNRGSPGGTLIRRLRVLAVLLGLAYVAARFAGGIALLDNLSNFPVHFAAGFLACAVLFASLKSRSWSFACCGAAALAFAPVVPWYFGQAADPGDATRPFEKFFVSNVYFANNEHELLRQRIAEENPDLVGLIEVTSTWIGKLEPLRADYPYHMEVPDERFVGLALYSRLPLSDARVLDLGLPSTPAIAATAKTQAGEIEFILVHTVPPLNAGLIRQRNEQILSISRYVRASRIPAVLAGDLNITMWNDGYRPLAETGGLHNARDGHGVGPTWPSILPIGVPIDHILATRDVALRDFRVLRGVGSDHLPISAEFSLR